MTQFTTPRPNPHHVGPVSPLVLSDRLITLAQDADRAGFKGTAERLVTLACAVLDESTGRPRCWGH